jgi:hypothetical protein
MESLLHNEYLADPRLPALGHSPKKKVWINSAGASKKLAAPDEVEQVLHRRQAEHHCPAVPQRELVRKGCSFITFYFYVLSLEYPQALSSSI